MAALVVAYKAGRLLCGEEAVAWTWPPVRPGTKLNRGCGGYVAKPVTAFTPGGDDEHFGSSRVVTNDLEDHVARQAGFSSLMNKVGKAGAQ